MNHTPGPWVIKARFVGPLLSPTSGLVKKVARICGDEPEAFANARLVAMAPLMFRGLKLAFEEMPAPLDDNDNSYAAHRYRAIRDMIAAVEGEEQ